MRGGKIGALELLDHYIARTERLDSQINEVVVRDFDRARDHARSLDQQRRDGRTMPLLGVPMTVKESFGVAGLRSTWGFEPFRNHVAHDDAIAVKRLKAAGVEFTQEPFEQPYGIDAGFRDPYGNHHRLTQRIWN